MTILYSSAAATTADHQVAMKCLNILDSPPLDEVTGYVSVTILQSTVKHSEVLDFPLLQLYWGLICMQRLVLVENIHHRRAILGTLFNWVEYISCGLLVTESLDSCRQKAYRSIFIVFIQNSKQEIQKFQ